MHIVLSNDQIMIVESNPIYHVQIFLLHLDFVHERLRFLSIIVVFHNF